MDIAEAGKDITEIDVLLPKELTMQSCGDVLVGDKTVSIPAMASERVLKIQLAEELTKPCKVMVNFEAVADSAESDNTDFSVKLMAADGTVVVDKLAGGNANANLADSNDFSGIAIVNDSPVPAPVNVTAEPVERENDVTVHWSAPEDKRIRAYQILADGKQISQVYGTEKTDYTHLNLEPETTISYTIVALVTAEFQSQPSQVAKVVVREDITAPDPPTEVEESIDEPHTVKITWQPSLSKDVVGYEILRGQVMDEMPKIATVPPDKTTYVDKEASETEVYSVRAVDDKGNMAMASMESIVFDRRILYQKIQEYRQRGELGKLFALTKRLMALGLPEQELAQNMLVSEYTRQRRLDELATFFENALKKAPTDVNLHKMLGQIYLRQRDFQRSTEMYEKAVELAPDDPDAYSNLGNAYLSQRLYDKAIASYKKALELEPQMTYLYSQLARAYAAARKKDEILKLAEELQTNIDTGIGQRPGSSYATLGDVYSAGGYHDKAIDACRKAVAISPEEPYLWDRLARAYEQAGKRDIASQIRGVMPTYGPNRGTGAILSLAPSITMKDISGKTISLSELQDKLLFVNFWTTWCPDCLREMSALDELYEAHQQENFVVLGISVDEDGEDAVKTYIEKRNITYPIIMSTSEILDAFETAVGEPVDNIPTTIIIGKGGVILKRYVGAQKKETLKQAYESASIPPQPKGAGNIRGTVVDVSPDRNPISGANVMYVGPGGVKGEVKTDDVGNYEITGLRPGAYVISVSKAGYAPRKGIPATVMQGADSFIEIKLRSNTK